MVRSAGGAERVWVKGAADAEMGVAHFIYMVSLLLRTNLRVFQ